MRRLPEDRLWRLWDRLEREAGEYYQTAHELKYRLKLEGPITEVAQGYADLTRQYHRLKRRFKVLAIIGTEVIAPGVVRATLSDVVICCADQVIGFGAIEEELEKETHNVRSW
jgi:hypothetical protein